MYLRQSTAGQEVPLGYFVDAADGNSEETGLTIANTDIKLWKFGATTLANKNSGGATHISSGIYYAVLDATDTNTVGTLVLFVHVAGALPVRLECEVLEEAVYDQLFAASAPGAATVAAATAIETDTQDLQSRLPAALVNGRMDATIDGTGMEAGAVAALADGVWDEAQSGHVGAGTFGEVATEVAAILVDTGTTLDGKLDTLDSNVDAILADTGTDGVLVAAGAKTGYSLAADQSGVTIGTVNALASGAIAAASLAAAACAKVADVVLRRTCANARASADGDTVGFRSLLGAVAKLVNKIDTTTNAGKLTVFAEDDSTQLGTQTLTTDGAAEPIVSADTDA